MQHQEHPTESGAERTTASDAPPLRDAVAEAFKATRQHLAELLELFTLEVRYSGLMLGSAVALAVVTALAVFSAWGLLLAALVSWLLSLEWSWTTALLTVAVANGLLAFSAIWLMRRALGRVGVDNTRKALELAVSDAPE